MHYYAKLCGLSEIRKPGYTYKDSLKKFLKLGMAPGTVPLLRKFYLFVYVVYGYSSLMSIYGIFINGMDFHSLLKYGPMLGIQLFNMDMFYIILFVFRDALQWSEQSHKQFMALQLSDGELLSRITDMATIVKFVLAANTISIICVNGGLASSQDFLNENTYNRVWFCQHFPPIACTIHGYILSLLDIPVFIAIVLLPFVLVYYELIAIAHINYMNEMIKTICDTSLPKKEIYDSELYQQIVTQKLKMCIMLHNTLIRISNEGAEMCQIPILLVIIGSMVLGSSLMLFYLRLDFDSISSIKFAINISLVNVAINVWYYIYFSQLMKDESEYSHHLLRQLPWYYMNKRNRQLYHIYMFKCETPISLQTYILEVNYVLLVRLFRSLYSIATILFRFNPSSQ